MAFIVPKRLFVDGGVPDSDDLNEDFELYIGELGGRLNEHNWSEAAFLYGTHTFTYDDDAGLQVAVASQTQDWTNASTPQGWKIPETCMWEVNSDWTKSITTTGGSLWILASWAFCDWYGWFDSSAAMTYYNYGCTFCIQINGQIVPESVVGTSELDNDLFSADTAANRVTTPLPCPRGSNSAVDAEGHYVLPLATDILVQLPAGTHTIDFAAMIVQFDNTATQDHYILNFEMIVIELK